ncbi:MAG: thiamine biosynthesis protein ThiF, partial [Selenomonadaceae bacterium]|nr:thiamine biosynthesis protein ThiF [Selenomonadaceae bacterium]
LEIAPYIEIETHNVKIDEQNATELLKDADIICEAFDNPEAKASLVNTVLEKMPEKYLIAASGMAGLGDPNSIRTRKITDKFYLSGDEISDTREGLSLFAPRVALSAAHQALTALRILSL